MSHTPSRETYSEAGQKLLDKIRIDQHIRVIRATDMTLPQTSIKCRSDTLLSSTVKDFSQLGVGLLDSEIFALFNSKKQQMTTSSLRVCFCHYKQLPHFPCCWIKRM